MGERVVHQLILITNFVKSQRIFIFHWHTLRKICNEIEFNNLQKSHHTLNKSLHYLVKHKCSKLAWLLFVRWASLAETWTTRDAFSMRWVLYFCRKFSRKCVSEIILKIRWELTMLSTWVGVLLFGTQCMPTYELGKKNRHIDSLCVRLSVFLAKYVCFVPVLLQWQTESIQLKKTVSEHWTHNNEFSK